MADNEMARPECEHAYTSIHQPDMPVYWIRQCSLCGAFDAEDLRREIAKAREVGGDNTGIALIAAERARQVSEEGYDAEHDRGHAAELISAAREYAAEGRFRVWNPGSPINPRPHPTDEWPWHPGYFKPTGDPIHDLTKAGALIAAAIDSLTPKENS